MEITDTHALGAKATQGLIVTDAFYWDMNDETRAFSKRFNEKVGHMPTMIQAGLYSATMHYLKAIEAIGTDEAPKVMAQMRATPINDFFAKNGKIRIDGRMVHDMYLFEVKKPEESKNEWDLYKLLATVPGDEAFRPLDKGGCPLVNALRFVSPLAAEATLAARLSNTQSGAMMLGLGASALRSRYAITKKRARRKPDALLYCLTQLTPYVEYLNSGIAFSSSLVALNTAWSGYQGLGFDAPPPARWSPHPSCVLGRRRAGGLLPVVSVPPAPA